GGGHGPPAEAWCDGVVRVLLPHGGHGAGTPGQQPDCGSGQEGDRRRDQQHERIDPHPGLFSGRPPAAGSGSLCGLPSAPVAPPMVSKGVSVSASAARSSSSGSAGRSSTPAAGSASASTGEPGSVSDGTSPSDVAVSWASVSPASAASPASALSVVSVG